MLHVIDLRTAKKGSQPTKEEEAPPLDARVEGPNVRTLSAGDFLFQEGDPRTHSFRVETGGICVYKTLPDGSRDVIEFAFSGDLVGLGYHDRHVTAAQATTQTSVSCLPRAARTPLNEKEQQTKDEATPAAKGEVALVRDALVHAAEPEPIQRVAALFVTLSRCNGYEGRAPNMITDSLKCGVVASYLNMSLDLLAAQLTELEARGLIESAAAGLRLKDIAALEKLADGAV